MSPHPGRIKTILSPGLPRPRTEDMHETPEFMNWTRKARQALKLMSARRRAQHRRTGCATRSCRRCSFSRSCSPCWAALRSEALDIPPWLLPAPTDVVDRFFKTHDALVSHRPHRARGARRLSWSRPCSACRCRPASCIRASSNAACFPTSSCRTRSRSSPSFRCSPSGSASASRRKIMICAIISFFPIVTNTTRGLKATDRRIIEFMRSINATRSEILLKVQLPSALPFIFASFKIAASLALVGAVVAEFYSSDRGLGYLDHHVGDAASHRSPVRRHRRAGRARRQLVHAVRLPRAHGDARRAHRGDAMTPGPHPRCADCAATWRESPFDGWVEVDGR